MCIYLQNGPTVARCSLLGGHGAYFHGWRVSFKSSVLIFLVYWTIECLVGALVHGFYFSIQLGVSPSQLTTTFSEGLKPPTRCRSYWYSLSICSQAEVLVLSLWGHADALHETLSRRRVMTDKKKHAFWHVSIRTPRIQAYETSVDWFTLLRMDWSPLFQCISQDFMLLVFWWTNLNFNAFHS